MEGPIMSTRLYISVESFNWKADRVASGLGQPINPWAPADSLQFTLVAGKDYHPTPSKTQQVCRYFKHFCEVTRVMVGQDPPFFALSEISTLLELKALSCS